MPGAAPANPTGLNFQSDPSMRAQFKGFMSGMSAKQPAPMMQQPLPMPPSMQNVDIFQPSMPIGMAMGGSVGYSDPYESAGTAGTVNFSSGGYEQEAFGGSDDGNRYDSLGNTVNFTSASAPPTASDSDPAMDALAQALANTAKANAAEQARQQATIDPALSQRFQDIQAADTRNTARTNIADTLGEYGTGAGTGTGRAVDAIGFDPNLGFGEFDRNIDLLGDAFGPNDVQAMQNPVSGTPAPISPPPEVQSVRGLEGQAMGPFDLANRVTPEGLTQNVVTGPTSRPENLGFSREGLNEGQISGAPLPGSNLGGIDEDLVNLGVDSGSSSAVQQAADKARAEALDIPGYDPDAEVPGIFTTAKGNAAMDKLLDRAQNFEQSGIGGFLNKITGGRANFANRMASDIINKGYTPIFDRAGNIVATRNPETGQLGAGSVEARIPGMAGSGGGGGPQMSVADQVAAALKRLGIGEDDEGEQSPQMINRPPEAGPGDPINFPVNPPTEAAQVGNPLGLGYGQISGLTPNLNSAADDFLRLLGGGR